MHSQKISNLWSVDLVLFHKTHQRYAFLQEIATGAVNILLKVNFVATY